MLDAKDILSLMCIVKKMNCKEIKDFNNVLQDEFLLKFHQEFYNPIHKKPSFDGSQFANSEDKSLHFKK